MGLRKLSKALKEGLPAPCYYIHSTDRFFTNRTIQRIRALVPETEIDLSLFVFDMSSSERPADFNQVLDTANTAGFFQNRKFILLLNFQSSRKKEKEAIYSYLKSPSPLSTVVLFSEKPPDENIKSLLQNECIINLDLGQKELRQWIKGI